MFEASSPPPSPRSRLTREAIAVAIVERLIVEQAIADGIPISAYAPDAFRNLAITYVSANYDWWLAQVPA